MPGINLLFSWNKDAEDYNNLFSRAQRLVKHNPQYNEEILFMNKFCIIGCTKHGNYPVCLFDLDNYKIIIDGMIYNKDITTIKSELSNIAFLLDTDSENINREIKDWILNSDGEYNILFFECKKQNLFVINDTLGRLPLYYFISDDIFILSREVNFITQFMDKITFDKQTLAEYILFSAPLGNKTLISNVKRLQAATVMTLAAANKNLTFSRIHMFNLDRRENSNKSIKENAAQLGNIFLDACKNRYNSLKQSKNIIALSGGLDSRAVAIGLKKVKASFFAASFLDFENTMLYRKDANIAKIIAKKLEVKFKLFKLPQPGIKEIECLLQYKGGLNYVGMSFILNFFKDIKANYGANVSYWTGDEGNALIANSLPKKRLRDTDELIEYIISSWGHGHSKLERIERFLNIDTQEIRKAIKDIVEQYPEQNLNHKFLHFFFFDYLYKVQYEGEDRNRVFFWSVAPMYSIFFFNYVLNIPDYQKECHKLYKEFLISLSPEMAKIKNSNWGYSVISRESILKGRGMFKKELIWKLRRLLSLYIPKIIKNNSIYAIPPLLNRYIIDILKTSPTLSKLNLTSNLKMYLLLEKNIEKVEFYNILTIISFISMIERNQKGKYEISNLTLKDKE